jgi:hypothetical protein
MALAGIAAFPAVRPDPRDLVRRSIKNGETAWERSRRYTYTKRDAEKQFDSSGHAKSADVDVYRVFPVNGDSFEQWVRHDGQPLSTSRQNDQERKLAARRRESPSQAAQRLAKERREREFYKEIPDAFDFRIVGEEPMPTGPAWVLEATPHPGYAARSRYARMFPKMRGKLWIDQKDLQWVKADAVAAETVTFGFFIARLAKGSHIVLEQTRLPDGDWVPREILARAAARTFVFFNHDFEEDITYSDFRLPPASPPAQRGEMSR